MGKLHSIINISGKVGDFVYYKLNGKMVVRKAATRRKDPMSQNRQAQALNSMEFGKASVAGKVLRQALKEEIHKLNDRYLYQRVNKLVMQLRVLDSGEVGKRTVSNGLATEEGQTMMANFEFHKKRVEFPKLISAELHGTTVEVLVSDLSIKPAELLEMQINFDKGLFRKYYHSFPQGIKGSNVNLKRQFRSRKDYTDFIVISGNRFLQGVVLRR